MYNTEAELKMKAGMAYFQKKAMSNMRDNSFQKGLMLRNFTTDTYLWNPTISVYIFTFLVWMFCRKRYSLTPQSVAFFMTFPVVYDYMSK